MSTIYESRLYDALTNLVQAVEEGEGGGVNSALAFAEIVIEEVEARKGAAPEKPASIDYSQSYKVLYEQHGLLAAIKAYRDRTGEGLRESKDALEEMAADEGWIRM